MLNLNSKKFLIKNAQIDDIEYCSQLLVKSMIIREKYMILSHQSFPFTVAKYLDKVFNDENNNERKNVSFMNSDKEFEIFDTDKDHGIDLMNYMILKK